MSSWSWAGQHRCSGPLCAPPGPEPGPSTCPQSTGLLLPSSLTPSGISLSLAPFQPPHDANPPFEAQNPSRAQHASRGCKVHGPLSHAPTGSPLGAASQAGGWGRGRRLARTQLRRVSPSVPPSRRPASPPGDRLARALPGRHVAAGAGRCAVELQCPGAEVKGRDALGVATRRPRTACCWMGWSGGRGSSCPGQRAAGSEGPRILGSDAAPPGARS